MLSLGIGLSSGQVYNVEEIGGAESSEHHKELGISAVRYRHETLLSGFTDALLLFRTAETSTLVHSNISGR